MAAVASPGPPPLPPSVSSAGSRCSKQMGSGRERAGDDAPGDSARRQRSSSVGSRFAALAEACATRVRRSLTPTSRAQDGDQPLQESPASSSNAGASCPSGSRGRSSSLGRLASSIACGAGLLRRTSRQNESSPMHSARSLQAWQADANPSSSSIAPTVVVVRPRQENSSNDLGSAECTAARSLREALPGAVQDMDARQAVPSSAAKEASEEQAQTSAPVDERNGAGTGASTTVVSAANRVSADAGPQGGVEISIDFGPRTRAPPGLHERLSRQAPSRRRAPPSELSDERPGVADSHSRRITPASAASHQTGHGAPAQSDAVPRGVQMSFDFGTPATERRLPPPGLCERLSRGRPARKDRKDISASEAATVATGRPPPAPSQKVGTVSEFLSSSEPAIYLADHDSLRFDSGRAMRSAVTTDSVKKQCQDLRGLDAAGVRTILSWRLAINHEQRNGTLPTEEEVAAMYEAEVVKVSAAKREISAAGVGGVASAAGGSSASSSSQSRTQANIVQQMEGLRAEMTSAADSKATDEDAQVLADLNREIEELSQALKAPDVSSKDAYMIRKQLGQRRAEKARAERAVRKGRKAALEIKGGDEAVQAILQSVSAAAPSLRDPPCPAALAAKQDPADLETAELNAASRAQLPRPPGLSGGEAFPAEGALARDLAVLLHPGTLMAAGSAAIGRLGLISRSFREVALDATDAGFGDFAWRCICKCFSRELALYCPDPSLAPGASNRGDWRKLMFEHLWPARKKWEAPKEPVAAARLLGEIGASKDDSAHDFKIQVSVRFKPGETSKAKLLVPLHQKLTLLKKSGEDSMSKICKQEPPEFLDALMGHLMVDPVRLPSSGKICDRRVVEEQLAKRGAQDPFDGSPLSVDMLEPQDELRGRIQEWRAESRKRASDGGEDQKLEEDEVRELITELGSDMDPELVEMLLEADRLRAAGNRAMRDAANKPNRKEADDDDEEQAEGNEETRASNNDAQGSTAAPGTQLRAMPVAGARRLDERGVEAAEEELGEAPKREGPKLLAVLPPTRVAMFQPGAGIRPFVFGRVFDGDAAQDFVYEHAASGSVCAALNGFNACLLVYGQTGSGKTHTMFGQSVACGGNAGAVVSKGSGCVVRALREIFGAAQELEEFCGVTTTLTAQYVQVYQDQVTCLCSGNTVSLREAVAGAPVVLQGAEEKELMGLGDASALLMSGEERKRYAETAMNHRSSRAHTILVVKIAQRRGDSTLSSQLHLVDLAGSERVKKSKAQGGRLVEAVGINSSLMVLGQCIAARVEERSHVPYYESKLTLLLRSALGGNSRTTAIICCHKEDAHGDETLQALSFGERCAMVSTRAHAAMAKSRTGAIAAIDEALAECSKRMDGLVARGKGHLPAFAKLQGQHETLSRKRAELTRT